MAVAAKAGFRFSCVCIHFAISDRVLFLRFITMTIPLEKSPFSHSFNVLFYLGGWQEKHKTKTRYNLYTVYKVIMSVLSFCGSYCLIIDLCIVLGDVKKTSWNLCVSSLFIGSLVKLLLVFKKATHLNDLRTKLHEDAETRTNLDDIVVNNLALRELKILRFSLYGGAIIFIPVWLVSRYFSYLWGRREWPLPLHLPVNMDPEDDEQYNYIFFVCAAVGLAGLFFVIESELSMFSILIQICREYTLLVKHISSLNKIYEKSKDSPPGNTDKRALYELEINPCLKRLKTKKLMKYIFARQQTLVQYTEIFEKVYNMPMLIQFSIGSLLVIVSGVQAILASEEFSMDLIFQLGYSFIITGDIFLVCWFSTRIRGLCYDVGEAAYFTLWYRMDADNQKEIRMIIMRSQSPPKITSGKMMILNLNTFMQTMKGVYSWLTLFRQLEFSSG